MIPPGAIPVYVCGECELPLVVSREHNTLGVCPSCGVKFVLPVPEPRIVPPEGEPS